MKRILFVVAALLLCSVLINVYLWTSKKQPIEIERLPNDHRISVKLSSPHREFMMNEMRNFVENVYKINQGLMENNPTMIMEAAYRSGSAVDAPDDLPPHLPKAFLKMGVPTHKLFDRIGDSAKINFKPQTTRRQLTRLMQKCVMCHSTYRVDVIESY